MRNKIPLILGCTKLSPDISITATSLRSIGSEFYLLSGENYPKRVFRVIPKEGEVKLFPSLNDHALLDKLHDLKRLLGNPRNLGEPIAINWGQGLAGVLLKRGYALVYTPLTDLVRFRRVFHSADDTIATVVGCDQRRCTAIVWDPLTGESAEYDIELRGLKDVSCRRGVCVINSSEESVIVRLKNSPVYLPLTPTYPLSSCGGTSYILYRSSEGGFVIEATIKSVDPLIPIEGMPLATCLSDSLVLCSGEVGCGILRERVWMSLTNRFFVPISSAEVAALNPLEGMEVVLVNSSGVVTSIRSRMCAPNEEGLLLCIGDDYVVVSSANTLVEPTIEVLKDSVDAETYATIRARLPGGCSDVEVVGEVSGQRVEGEGVVYLYLRPVRLGDTVSPVIMIKSPLAEFTRKITITSSAPRIDYFRIEKAVASSVGWVIGEPSMNALVVGHATVFKTSPGEYRVHIIVPLGFKASNTFGKDHSVRFRLVGRSRSGAAIPISFKLVDEVGTEYIIPGSVIRLGEAEIDRVVHDSTIKVGRDGIKAPGKVRIICADGKIIEPYSDERCFLPSIVETVLVKEDFEAEISRVISCTDSDIPKNFLCKEVGGEVSRVAITGDGVLKVSGSVGITVVCGGSVGAGKNVEVRLDPLDLADGCRVFTALENPQPVIITRDELIRKALMTALLAAEKLSSEVGMSGD